MGEITSSQDYAKRAANVYRMIPIALLLLLIIIFGIFAPKFATTSNISNLLTQVSFDYILALGITLVVAANEIDISVAGIATLAGVLAAGVMRTGISAFAGVAVSLLVGLMLGLLNGIMVAKIKIPALIVSLGMLSIMNGITMIYTSIPIYAGNSPIFLFFGKGSVFGVPVPILWLVIVSIIMYWLLGHTKWGSELYAVGFNRKAAALCGVNVEWRKINAYMLSGSLAGLAAIIKVARQGMAIPWQGLSIPLDPLAATFIGTMLSPVGQASVAGTLIGAVLIGVLTNGLTLMGINAYTQGIIKGIAIVFSVGVLAKRRTRK